MAPATARVLIARAVAVAVALQVAGVHDIWRVVVAGFLLFVGLTWDEDW